MQIRVGLELAELLSDFNFRKFWVLLNEHKRATTNVQNGLVFFFSLLFSFSLLDQNPPETEFEEKILGEIF